MTDLDFTTDGEDAKDRNFVTALARGLEVLRCFRPNEIELTNTDFAERTGLPKPTVSRLTHTLCKLDYLVADPRTGTYRLGAGVLQLGFGVLSGMDIADRAAEVMRALRNGPNSYITVALGERHRLDVVYVAVQSSREDVALTMRVGSRLPLFFSAIGRAILVGMSDEDREAVFDLGAREHPDQEQARRESFASAKAEYESEGICRGYGDWRPDVNGIAVPVFSLNGARVYGMNVGGPAFHVKPKQLETYYAKHLISAAKSLSFRG
ncbi:IclR family transcriptional regulator [Arenibacterium sp. CAU 1754]